MSDTMTTEIRDWHARRAGFKWNAWVEGDGQWEHDNGESSMHSHPFPMTMDGADASFPPDWDWCRLSGNTWWATNNAKKLYAVVPDTGDKIHNLYALSRLAWEQEAAS
jgi:hypothetical protein